MACAFFSYVEKSKRQLELYRTVFLAFDMTIDRLINDVNRINNVTECFIDEMKQFKKSDIYKAWKMNQ